MAAASSFVDVVRNDRERDKALESVDAGIWSSPE